MGACCTCSPQALHRFGVGLAVEYFIKAVKQLEPKGLRQSLANCKLVNHKHDLHGRAAVGCLVFATKLALRSINLHQQLVVYMEASILTKQAQTSRPQRRNQGWGYVCRGRRMLGSIRDLAGSAFGEADLLTRCGRVLAAASGSSRRMLMIESG